ncbi:MAG: prohibitin family protein [Anaerolineae bacterium]|nr:prohibitin family protein [Anaerolineae bacterium]
MNIDLLLKIGSYLAWGIFLGTVSALLIRAAARGQLSAAFAGRSVTAMIFALLVVIASSILSASVVFIQPQEVGVVVSILYAEGFRDQPLRSGLHLIVPLAEEVVTYPIYWQTYTMSVNPLEGAQVGNDAVVARTRDGQEVFIDCSIIFRIDPVQVVWLNVDWQNRYIVDLIRPVTRGLVRTEVSQFTVDEVNSNKREDLENSLNDKLREILEEKGLMFDRFVLRNITFSPEYAAAVEQKQVALQRTAQREYEAEQIRKLAAGQADQVKILAQANADARVIQATAEARALQLIAAVLGQNPNLLTYQYINKLSPAIKVMLVPSNAPYILPLPDLYAGEAITSVYSTSTLTVTPGITFPTGIITPVITPVQ